jgi:hypothetical protein
MIKYSYKHEKFKTPMTINKDFQPWVEEQLNTIGETGRRVIGFPVTSQWPSDLVFSDGKPIMDFVITVLVETSEVVKNK